MADTVYTRADIDGMRRVEVRQLAVKLGMTNLDASKAKSPVLIDFILSKQGGGGEKVKGKPGRPTKVKAPEPEEVDEDEDDEDEDDEEEKKPSKKSAPAASTKSDASIEARIDILGKELDTMSSQFERANYILIGLAKDILSTTWEPDDVDKRIEELNKEYDEGN